MTFDDGPSEWTDAVLDLLDEHSVPATFFAVGMHAVARPETLRRVAAAGHAIGNHTWSHPDLTELADDDVAGELARAGDAILATTGWRPTLYRAPHFRHDERVDAVAGRLGLRHVAADVAVPDWHAGWSAKLTITSVLSRVTPDSVVCVHDGVPPHDDGDRQATVDALAVLIPRLLERGYDFEAVR
jgi:peptidoglycan-N-acetylglucosamine deacetylase